jgi:SAM-dependent methyltransferase
VVERFFDTDYVATLRDQKPLRQTRAEVDFLVRSLGLREGGRILDIPCGYGRHASELARRGFPVVGVDLSRAMIAEARRRWTEGPRLRFLRQDMRRIVFRNEFDAVVNLYTSFGYFAPRENEAVLRRMAGALRPGGRILIDHRDPGYDARLPHLSGIALGPAASFSRSAGSSGGRTLQKAHGSLSPLGIGGWCGRRSASRSSPFHSGGGCSGESAFGS